MPSLTLSIVEIIVLMLGAIVLGITIHFFLTSRRNLRESLSPEKRKAAGQMNEWKLKYLNDMEVRDKELATLRQQLQESDENRELYTIEAEELKKENRRLLAELESARKAQTSLPPGEKVDYYEQLREARLSLIQQNEKINSLLSNLDIIRETEEKQQEILRDNEELYGQIEELRGMLAQKEQEIGSISQKATWSKEMTSMLDNAYSEFNALQDKIHKLEAQVNSSKAINIEHEDLKEAHLKLQHDYEAQKEKFHAITEQNNQLREELGDVQEKLNEANMQRQQLQKRVSYLEELNNDLQAVSEANKRLETQIRRIGELESMLNVISEERNQLIRKKE